MTTAIDQQIGKRLGDLSDLPDSLRRQLSSQKLDDLEWKILNVLINPLSGVGSIDEIMVGLYREHKYVTPDRKSLSSKLYRMVKAELLSAVERKKGVYQPTTEGINKHQDGEL